MTVFLSALSRHPMSASPLVQRYQIYGRRYSHAFVADSFNAMTYPCLALAWMLGAISPCFHVWLHFPQVELLLVLIPRRSAAHVIGN